MALCVLILAPFLNSPFTIDDPIFLREARQILHDPLHPQAFNMVWTYDVWARASQIIQGGLAAGYLLVPTALAGYAEWVGHLTTLFFLLAALWATAMAGLRLGLTASQARWASLLTGLAPAVLGMAGTVMPDIAALAFTALGMERILAWREGRKPLQALGAVAALSLAALSREQTALMLAAAGVFLLDGIAPVNWLSSIRKFPWRFLPVLLVPLVYFGFVWLTKDPNPGPGATFQSVFSDRRTITSNAAAFLAHWCLVTPFALPWIALRWAGWRMTIPAAVFLVACLAEPVFGLVILPAALGAFALADLGIDALRRMDRDRTALFLWMLPGLAPAFFFHLPAKYLVPSMPAAAILLCQLAPAGAPLRRVILAATAAAGAIAGVLILAGTADLARAQRRAAEELIAPRVRNGQRVLFLGHWGFDWYAEKAGAQPATIFDPAPQPGETIVASFADNPTSIHREIRREVIDERSDVEPGGRVMDIHAHAGFFSNGWGILPWAWGTQETNRFEVWKVD